MCSTVYDEKLNRELGTLAELRAAGLPIIPADYDDDWDEDTCLCGVDTVAIAVRSGRPYRIDDTFGDVILQ